MPHPLVQRALDLFKPDTTEPPPAVRFVPAPLLFIHAEPLPEGMQPSELQGFAEVTMETLAPMPLEQLSWGYLNSERATHLLLFAASRDRLESENLLPENSFFHVLPSFFAAAPADASAHWVFIWEAGHLTALHYDAESAVPTRVEVEPLIEDNPAGAFAARERLLKRLGSAGRVEAAAGLLTLPDAVRGPRERLSFFFTQYPAPDTEPVRIEGRPPANPAALWSADLRDNLFRTAEQQRRRTLRILNNALKWAAGAALVLFTLQLVWAAGTIWVNAKTASIDKQKTLVTQVLDNQALLKKIDQFSAHQLRPFEMMAAINDLRPRGIVYRSYKATDGDKIVAQCTAPDPSVMNDFFDAIAKSGLADAAPPAPVFSRGGVTFNLALTFRQSLQPEPMPEDKPADATATPGTPGAPGAPASVAQTLTFPQRPTVTLNPGIGVGAGPQTEGPPGGFGGGGPGGGPPGADPNAQPVEATPAPAGPAVYLN